ncbi:hypothetical protein PBT90_05485 [Algoriphagus halophytocola]|uniref:Uncharacterized protein n=1 Tax=Algoriphagus halophytocola TaxID=2991499 RepID=A0ABY6MKY8_9BACT|nr:MULTISPECIES: hypothetical protein [unclassified Algoriphagus]UZD22869.1 hypothetical protein OM944_19745 [Algoriphagus sp. TR-M5]WBL44136.1 hypothetical protein PBT90_05485 [Algoriphagus sp. TR-M9]
MKKLLFLFLVMMTLSCQDDTEPLTPTNPPTGQNPEKNFTLQDVQIQLPEGSSLDLTGSELLSFGESFPVENDGKTKAIKIPSVGQIAYLFNSEGQLLLAGYLSEDQKALSPATTANYLIYLASGYWLSEADLASPFFKNIGNYEEVKAWQDEFEEMWKTDPKLLSGNSYQAPLQELMKKLSPKPNELDIRSKIAEQARVSDIAIDESDIKSGIQVFEKELGKIAISNYYRRRAHAFFYKMKTKKTDGSVVEHLSNIGKGTGSELDFPVNATTGYTTATGAMGAAIEGSVEAGDVVTTDPKSLSLADNEDEKTYKVRVVGAGGVNNSIQLTDQEQIKQIRLSMETFVLDFFLPIGMQMVGWKGELNSAGFNVGDGPLVSFIDEMEVIINASPGTYDKIKEGDYKGALDHFLKYLAFEGAGNKNFEEVLGGVIHVTKYIASKQNIDIEGVSENLDTKAIGKFANILKIVNTAMAGQDLARVSFGISMSKNIEEWTIHARSAKVSLLPAEATVSSRGNKEIKAEIKNLEEEGGDNFPYFKWITSGKFGYIQDRKGNKGKSFDSSDKEIIYYSETSAADLPEENNFEYVYVEAYYKNELIGRDTTVLNLKKSSYMLKPGGLVLSGKEDQISSAKLYIEPVNLRDADFSGKKVVWSTEGKHGRLVNFAENSTVITTYDTNSIRYLCTDEDTEKGKETVKARIYEKSAVDGEYFLYEELTLEIEIDNSENIKIITVDLQVKSFSNQTGNYLNCGSGVHFLIQPDPDAISYTARIIDFSPGANVMIGRSASWSANKAPDENGQYEFSYVFVKSGSKPVNKGWPDCGGFAAEAGKYSGKAQVVIRLKDPG